MLSLDDATSLALAACAPLEEETISLRRALGRVLCDQAQARLTLPAWDNSAMDGYALRSADLPGPLPLAGHVAAGDALSQSLPAKSCMRIMTGAPVPAGADTVVMRENCREDDEGLVHFIEDPVQGRHIRRAGEDTKPGQPVVPAGRALCPGDINMLAAQGYEELRVHRQARVALLATGNELVPLGQEPKPGQLINSNALGLAAQCADAGALPSDAGIVGDTLDATIAAIRSLADYDLLITCGGVSVGDHDHVKPAMEALGFELLFWKAAIKPGKPIAIAKSPRGQLLAALPGNPASAFVGFELFVRPMLRKLHGHRNAENHWIPVTLGQTVSKKAGRAHLLRATVERGEEGLVASPFGKQGSGMQSSLAQSDALIRIEADVEEVEAGTQLPALLLRPGL